MAAAPPASAGSGRNQRGVLAGRDTARGTRENLVVISGKTKVVEEEGRTEVEKGGEVDREEGEGQRAQKPSPPAQQQQQLQSTSAPSPCSSHPNLNSRMNKAGTGGGSRITSGFLVLRLGSPTTSDSVTSGRVIVSPAMNGNELASARAG